MTILYKEKDGKRLYFDTRYQFSEYFNPATGFYLRTDNAQGQEPFMRDFPALIDVGVMGHCEHGKSGLCVKAGVQCYQNGLGVSQPNMSVEDYENLLTQCAGKVNTFALGGRGDPNKHESFRDILHKTCEYGIVPNYTTSGLKLTQKEVNLTALYCGAVAVSWYRSQYTLDAIRAFAEAGCITNVHYVLGKNSIKEAIERLGNDGFPSGINAVIFLMHKPVGLGQSANVLRPNNPDLQRFFEIVDKWNGPFQLGFDSCAIPGIINFTNNVNLQSIDTCEGARFSAYITPDLIMTPCSFDQDLEYGISLKERTIQEVWDSYLFDEFRYSLRRRCPDCPRRESCMGGCPLKPEIVLCKENYED